VSKRLLDGKTAFPGAALICFFLLGAGSAQSARQCQGNDIQSWTADSAADAVICLAPLAAFTLTEYKHPLNEEVNEWFKKGAEDRVRSASDLLMRIRDNLKDKVLPNFEEGRPLLLEIDSWLAKMMQLTSANLSDPQFDPLQGEGAAGWQYDAGRTTLLERSGNKIVIRPILESECRKSAEQCTKALRGAAELVVHMETTHLVANGLLVRERQKAADYVTKLDQQWTKYFDESRFQYPWELGINSWRFKERGGLVPPPSDQIIFMHPSVGFRYSRQAASSFDQALVLEIAGYYRWRWEGGDTKGLIGGSLIATRTNEPDAAKTGYGVMVHLPKNMSVGVTRQPIASGHATAVIVSLDIAKLFQDKENQKLRLLGLK